MKISKIYKNYQIMPFLQLHMLRVTAVAKLIAQNMKIPVDETSITCTCLLHDMGNIIKFNLSLFPQALEPEGYAYWKDVQNKYKSKYGNDEHSATYKIAAEIGVSQRVNDLLHKIGFSRSEEIYVSNDFDLKICAYADNRVSPQGIISLDQRLADGQKRFMVNKPNTFDLKFFQKMQNFSKLVEAQIFEKCKIKPEAISDASVNPLLAQLRRTSI